MCHTFQFESSKRKAIEVFDVGPWLFPMNPKEELGAEFFPMQQVPIGFIEDEKRVLGTHEWGLLPKW